MNYKDFKKENIGYSDVAALILVGCGDNGLKVEILNFGEDGDYSAYIVKGDAKIGSHYHKVTEFKYWLKVYDDEELVQSYHARKFVVYRAGDFGCIIQLLDEE